LIVHSRLQEAGRKKPMKNTKDTKKPPRAETLIVPTSRAVAVAFAVAVAVAVR